MNENLKCLDDRSEGSDCTGAVEYRFALSGTGKSYPRCDGHWDARLKRQKDITRRYAPFSDVPPADFDPAFAGECWEDD